MYGVIFGCHTWTGNDTSIQWARILLTSYNAGNSPPHMELLAPDVHSAEDEK